MVNGSTDVRPFRAVFDVFGTIVSEVGNDAAALGERYGLSAEFADENLFGGFDASFKDCRRFFGFDVAPTLLRLVPGEHVFESRVIGSHGNLKKRR